MATLTVWPGLSASGTSLTVYAEDLVTLIPSTGATVTLSSYYSDKLRGGLLVTEDPLGGGGSPIQVDERAYALTPELFGAAGNGLDDDTTPVQLALDAIHANGGGTLVLSRKYVVENLVAYSNTNIVGSGFQSQLIQKYSSATHHYCLSVNAGSAGTSDPTQNVSRIVLRDLALVGTVGVNGFSQFQFLLNLNAASNVLCENVTFYGFRGDAVYLGSSNDGGLERHNENITFRKCVFDGVNKDNRNAISIIDGVNVLVEDCVFQNCTRADQPGAIDIEPNPGDAYARIRRITIRNNKFYNVGGNVGFIGMVMWTPQASLTLPVHGISIEGNMFDSSCTGPTCVAMIQHQNATASTPSQGLTVRGNHASGGGFRAYNVGGMRGPRFLGNDWIGMNGGALFGTAGDYANYDVLFSEGERFFQCAKTSGDCIALYDNTKVKFADVILDSCGLPSGAAGVAITLAVSATTTDIDVSGVTIVPGGRTLSAIVKQSGHTMNTSLNRKKGWRSGGLGSDFVAAATGEELIAQVTVNVPNIASGASYTSSPISVPGAAFYDPVKVSGSQDLQGCQLSAYVSAADTVKFTVVNNTGSAQDLANMDFTVWVVKS